MSVIYAEPERRADARQLLALGFVLSALILFFFRLWYLQVVEASVLSARADVLRKSVVNRLAPRGTIVDRNGALLAGVKPRIVITAVPAIVAKNPRSLNELSLLTGVPLEDIEANLQKNSWRPYLPTPAVIGVDMATATRVAESADWLPGLAVETQPIRYYTNTTALAHILGYVATPSKQDVERISRLDQKPADYVGKVGIEYVYERQLMGTAGVDELEIDSKRRPLRKLKQINPRPGDRLALSIDINLQKYALELLKNRRGAVAAIEPKTGEVLCLASSPTYDTALFEGGISKKNYAALQADTSLPQLNRAIFSAYAPGSTFKIVTSIAGALSGKWDPNRPTHCAGGYRVGNRFFKCLGNHGSITFHRAFTKSCNAYFYELGMRSGEKALRDACKLVGLGERTGVDLLGESKGIVPTLEWIAKWRKPVVWYPGDTANFSIGQGEVSATPLQMASLASLVANDGTSYVPHIVRAIRSSTADSAWEKVAPTLRCKVDLPARFWTSLKSAMVSVIEEGTARRAMVDGIRWGGKTGSSQNVRNRQTHSWFVGVAPMDKPKIAIAVLVENAGHGGDIAAPIASQIVSRYLKPQRDSNLVASRRDRSALSSSPTDE